MPSHRVQPRRQGGPTAHITGEHTRFPAPPHSSLGRPFAFNNTDSSLKSKTQHFLCTADFPSSHPQIFSPPRMTDFIEIPYLLCNKQQWHTFPSSLHGHFLCIYKVCDDAGGKPIRLTLAVRTHKQALSYLLDKGQDPPGTFCTQV